VYRKFLDLRLQIEALRLLGSSSRRQGTEFKILLDTPAAL
jgi:hypothetical protein